MQNIYVFCISRGSRERVNIGLEYVPCPRRGTREINWQAHFELHHSFSTFPLQCNEDRQIIYDTSSFPAACLRLEQKEHS